MSDVSTIRFHFEDWAGLQRAFDLLLEVRIQLSKYGSLDFDALVEVGGDYGVHALLKKLSQMVREHLEAAINTADPDLVCVYGDQCDRLRDLEDYMSDHAIAEIPRHGVGGRAVASMDACLKGLGETLDRFKESVPTWAVATVIMVACRERADDPTGEGIYPTGPEEDAEATRKETERRNRSDRAADQPELARLDGPPCRPVSDKCGAACQMSSAGVTNSSDTSSVSVSPPALTSWTELSAALLDFLDVRSHLSPYNFGAFEEIAAQGDPYVFMLIARLCRVGHQRLEQRRDVVDQEMRAVYEHLGKELRRAEHDARAIAARAAPPNPEEHRKTLRDLEGAMERVATTNYPGGASVSPWMDAWILLYVVDEHIQWSLSKSPTL